MGGALPSPRVFGNGQMTPVRWKRLVAGGVAAALGAACTQTGGDHGLTAGEKFEAGYLAGAAEQSRATAHRFELEWRTEHSGELAWLNDQFTYILHGEQHGDRYSMLMDFTEMVADHTPHRPDGPSPGELEELDTTFIEIVGDGDVLFVRAPVLAMMAESFSMGQLPDDDPVAVLRDGWGRVDLSLDDPGTVADLQEELGGAPAGDPGELLRLVASADDVRESGDDRIRDVTAHGLVGAVSLGDLQEHGGVDLRGSLADMTGRAGGDLEALWNEVRADTLPVEVWIDDDGYVRRFFYTVDLPSVLASHEVPVEREGPVTSVSAELFDYGDESIDIRFPTDWVDITVWFLS